MFHDFCLNFANKSCRKGNCFFTVYDLRFAAISRAFLLILRLRFSEPAIDTNREKVLFFPKQVLCENKYYNLKEVLFF